MRRRYLRPGETTSQYGMTAPPPQFNNYFQYPVAYPPTNTYQPQQNYGTNNNVYVSSPGLKEVVTTFFPGPTINTPTETKKASGQNCKWILLIILLAALTCTSIWLIWSQNVNIGGGQPNTQSSTESMNFNNYESLNEFEEPPYVESSSTAEPGMLFRQQNTATSHQDIIAHKIEQKLRIIMCHDDDSETRLEIID